LTGNWTGGIGNIGREAAWSGSAAGFGRRFQPGTRVRPRQPAHLFDLEHHVAGHARRGPGDPHDHPQESLLIGVLARLWIAMAAILELRAIVRWSRVERAMRPGRGLPLASSIPIIALTTLALLGVTSGAAVILAS
jgi:hypothetical protein